VKRLPLDLRSRHPSVPWKEIAGTRDHLSHGYDDVDYQVLWEAVQNEVPALLATVERSSRCSRIWLETVPPPFCFEEIDTVLAGHYGLTAAELDFILNYDIKYRLGRDTETQEE
jgi:hypothetical protein